MKEFFTAKKLTCEPNIAHNVAKNDSCISSPFLGVKRPLQIALSVRPMYMMTVTLMAQRYHSLERLSISFMDNNATCPLNFRLELKEPSAREVFICWREKSKRRMRRGEDIMAQT